MTALSWRSIIAARPIAAVASFIPNSIMTLVQDAGCGLSRTSVAHLPLASEIQMQA